MKPSYSTYAWLGVIILLIVGAFVVLPFIGIIMSDKPDTSSIERAVNKKLISEMESIQELGYELSDPSQAPAPIRKEVEMGYKIMLATPQQLPDYVGDRLSCTNCHFSGGITTGGKDNGIPLVGVAAIYPRYDTRFDRVITLADRINNCMKRSMNGIPLPLNSPEMTSLLTYMQWISKDLPIYQKVEWLEIQPLKTNHIPDANHGKQIYKIQCAICHGPEGQGEVNNSIPPLWGPDSFNDSAGMNKQATLESFIYWNMPYNEPQIPIEDAMDVAAFIIRQPRPHLD